MSVENGMSSPSSSRTPVHLILLVHGLYGSPANLKTILEEVHRAAANLDEHDLPSQDKDGEYDETASEISVDEQINGPRGSTDLKVVTYASCSFTGSHTWDGTDVNAHRAAKEVDDEIDRLREERMDVVAFSIMAYSLGGLVARYLIGILHSRTPSFFSRHRPVCFSTAATPHLGVLKYKSHTNTIVHSIGRQLFSRSGQQMYCLDKDWEGGQSLLEVMADPDRIFLQALKLFPRIQIVANGCHDLTVPYPTATFSLSDPFEAFDMTGLQVDADQDHIVRSWHHPGLDDAVTPDQVVRAAVDKINGGDVIVRKRPRIPPIFILPYPFTYTLVILLPIIFPLWLCVASCIFIFHTWQSRRRHKLYQASMTSLASLTGVSTSSLKDAERPSIDPAPDTPNEETPLLDGILPPIPAVTAIKEYARPGTPPEMIAETPPLISDIPARPGQIPLLLTPRQKLMVKNLNEGLPQVERLIAWFPWAFNAHALLIARDVQRRAWQEEGRGVVRAWARFVVSSPEVIGMLDTI